MKKKIFALAMVLICVSILASTTLAYFTDAATARNTITSGGITVEIVEQQSVDGSLKPYPAEPIGIMPGATVSKIVTVQSVEQPAWVRMQYVLTVLDAEGNPMAVPAEKLTRMIVIETDNANWMQQDGWWYYNSPLTSGETAAPLFEQVHFSGPDMGNQYQNCTVVIDVTVQAVQQANNGSTVMEAAGWPEN